MRQSIKQVLDEIGVDYEEDVLRITVDCGGRDTTFLSIINLINEHIEEWTYEDMASFNIDIDLGYETVKFNF